MSFDLQEVFSSVQSFLGSGYVLLTVVALLGVSFIKKLMGLLITGCAIFLIWFFCQDTIFAAWQGILGILGEMLG